MAGALTHSRMRLVASARTTASLTAADAALSPSRPTMLSVLIWVTACSCRVLSEPTSKLLSPIPSVTARATSAAPALAATSLGRSTVTRR